MRKVIIITSGGLDSTVLLYHHYNLGDEIRALGINYGQRHKVELKFAAQNCRDLGVPYNEVELSCLASILPGSSQTDVRVPVPEGHYAAESMKATVVPNRNMILLSIALGAAIARKFDGVSYAAHAGDHAIYPDCRPEFVDALNGAAALADWHPAVIFRPFILWNKAGIVKEGHRLGVPFAKTYSCYQGKQTHCGVCGTCVERQEAFELAGVPDPTAYTPRKKA